MLMRPGTTVVTALSPRCGLPKFGSGLNTNAIHFGLMGIRMSYANNMEIFGEGEPAEYLYEVVRGLVRPTRCLATVVVRSSPFICRGTCWGSK